MALAPRQMALMRTSAAVVAWMLASSSLIFMNKQIYVDGFRFPMMATAVGQLLSFAGGGCLVAAGLFPCRPVPAFQEWIRVLLPIISCSVATLWLGNLAYLFLSVTFIQVLKGLTPGLTLALGAMVGVERISPTLAFAVVLTGGGVGFGAVSELWSAFFSWTGLFAFLGSSLTEAMRVVLVAKLQMHTVGRFNTAESLIYISLPCGLCLLGMSMIFEGPGVTDIGLQLVLRKPVLYFAAFSTSFFVNLTCYFALQVRLYLLPPPEHVFYDHLPIIPPSDFVLTEILDRSSGKLCIYITENNILSIPKVLNK